MLPKELKKLHLAKSLEELNKQIDKDLPAIHFDRLIISIRKLLAAAETADKDRDEERAYILYARALSVFMKLQNTSKYEECKNEYKSQFKSSIAKSIKRAEQLSKSLERRYAVLRSANDIDEQEKKARIVEKELDKINNAAKLTDSGDLDISNGCISCKKLKSLIDERCSSYLIIDVRPEDDFMKSKIKNDNVINVPEEILLSGITAHKIGMQIKDEDCRLLWDRRDRVDYLILYDWFSQKEPFPKSITCIKDAMFKWDPGKSYRSSPLILAGGLEMWHMMYPMNSVDPLVPAPINHNPPEILDTCLDFEYPGLSDGVTESISQLGEKFPSSENAINIPSFNRSLKPINKPTEKKIIPGFITNDISSEVTAHSVKKMAANIDIVYDNEGASVETVPPVTVINIPKEMPKPVIPCRDLKPKDIPSNIQDVTIEDIRLEEKEEKELKVDTDGGNETRHLWADDLRERLEQMKVNNDDVAKENKLNNSLGDKIEHELDKVVPEVPMGLDHRKMRGDSEEIMKPATHHHGLPPLKMPPKSKGIVNAHSDFRSSASYFTAKDMSAFTSANKRSGGLTRAHSAINLSNLTDEDDIPVTPTFDRTKKPSDFSRRSSRINVARQRDFEIKYGTVSKGRIGLRNLGNTCYMNSILQCINNTSRLVKYFIGGQYLSHINPKSKYRGEVAEELGAVIETLARDNIRSIAVRDLKATVGKYHRPFLGCDQHDSHEFLLKLMEWLHEDLNRVMEPKHQVELDLDDLPDFEAAALFEKELKSRNCSAIQDIFHGLHRSVVVCSACHHRSLTFEPFSVLTLSFPDGKRCTLIELIKDYYKETVIEYKCARCKQMRKCLRKIDIWKLAPVLVIHLNRFEHDILMRKRQNYVEFPLKNLNLSVFMSCVENSIISYDLHAVSNHYGTMDGGHYTAFCRSPASDHWYKFDDHEVYELTPDAVKTSAAYLLFFELAWLDAPFLKS